VREATTRAQSISSPYSDPVLLICAAVAAAVAYFMPASFWSEGKRELALAVFSGLLVFNGLILTLGWTAFSRIYDVLLRAEFGHAALDAAINNYSGQRFTLRNGILVIREHQPKESGA
jgi:TRAP-type uncharacterized transport system fused permease subunit